MMHFVKITLGFLVFCAILVGVTLCQNHTDFIEHERLTNGCVMVGTIQGYSGGGGRNGSKPPQEQWNCNGMMRTVNAVNE